MIKKSISIALTILAISISCQKNNNQVKTKKIEPVNLIYTIDTKTYNNIKTTSYINWGASHLGGIEPKEGKIYCKEVTVLVNDGKITNINTLIDMNSLIVDNMSNKEALELESHLKSSDFFNTKKYPYSKFELIKILEIEGHYNSIITGNLTILDTSRSITFKANIKLSDAEVSLNSEKFVIDRSDWGLTYHAEGAEGVPLNYLISNDLQFSIDITVN